MPKPALTEEWLRETQQRMGKGGMVGTTSPSNGSRGRDECNRVLNSTAGSNPAPSPTTMTCSGNDNRVRGGLTGRMKSGAVIPRPVPTGVSAPSPQTQTFFIPGPLPGANDIIRKHHMVYSRLKSQWGMRISYLIKRAKLKPVQTCTIAFAWQEANNRRDDDNVMFGQKFVLDALQAMQIIPNDRRSCVLSLTHRVSVQPTSPGVWLTIEEA